MKDKIKRMLWEYFLSGIRDGLAMQRLSPLVDGYLPWSSSTLSATAVETVLNEIVVNGRSKIVECGGGVSTVYIASLLSSQGREGHLYTIEHDSEWLQVVERLLSERGLSDRVTVVHAPLREVGVSWGGEMWYDTESVKSEIPTSGVDFILVDGPPAHRQENSHSRYPAIPILKEVLDDRYSVLLDDIDRQAEREIIESWQSSLGISFDERFLNGNFAIGTRGESFTV